MLCSVNVVLLHEHPEYLNACCDLLNRQWKRSFSARVQSLEKSYKDLPNSVLLLEEIDGEIKVIGHSRLTRVLEDEDGCWIESVVIAEEKRKKGYGKYLMLKTEEYAKTLKFSTAYLNTRDQQRFYEHLGYIYSSTVSSVSFRNNIFMKNYLNRPITKAEDVCLPKITECYKESECNTVRIETNAGPPPPPPPPLPLSKNKNMISNLGPYWMKKKI